MKQEKNKVVGIVDDLNDERVATNHSPQLPVKRSKSSNVGNMANSSEGSSLSDKICYLYNEDDEVTKVLFLDDVKEFIRKLKEELKRPIYQIPVCFCYYNDSSNCTWGKLMKGIDKLAGSGLVE